MSEINIILGTPQHSEGIVSLFKNNYKDPEYHYVELIDIDKNKKFVEENKVWVAIHNDKVVGHAAAYYAPFKNAVRVKLAHLLVDEPYRRGGVNYPGYSIGEKLEAERNKFYEDLQNKIDNKPLLVYASCVPGRSVELKKNIGFKALGIRTSYSPTGESRIIMGKIYNCSQLKRRLEMPTDKTKKFLKFISEKLNAEFVFEDSCNNTSQSKYQFAPISVPFRISAESHASGLNIDETINMILQSGMQYKSFYIEPSCANFKEVDAKLNEKGFVPVVYFPFYNNGLDVIEYQHKTSCTGCVFSVL
ncbi:MAG: GNAT family N-acetyltransferase [Candidatus Bathyarchaeota archaeon]|nr:GNAT family N-acetyltransferase [Candidatus Termiticorpusculum sp.]